MGGRTEISDYHDYVVKDGRFIGAFDEMYRQCDDPWHQDQRPGPEEDVALEFLAARSYRRILDVGCGKGRFTNRIKQATGSPVVALDVSATALRTARSRGDALDVVVARVPSLPFASGSFDLVVLSQLLWYVLPDLNGLLAEVKRMLPIGGQCLIVQTFYRPGDQQYGNDVMEKPEDLLRRLPFRLVRTAENDPRAGDKLIALAELP